MESAEFASVNWHTKDKYQELEKLVGRFQKENIRRILTDDNE
jgi:hypothetical protein